MNEGNSYTLIEALSEGGQKQNDYLFLASRPNLRPRTSARIAMMTRKRMKHIQRLRRAERADLTAFSVCFNLDGVK